MAHYEKLEQQGTGGKEALKFLREGLQQEVVKTEVEDTMTVIEPGEEPAWKEGIKLKKAAIHASDLTHQDLISRLRSAQIAAVQGSISKEFDGLGVIPRTAIGAAAGLVAALTGGTPAEKEQRRQEEEAKEKQLPITLIVGGLSLIILGYILIFKL